MLLRRLPFSSFPILCNLLGVCCFAREPAQEAAVQGFLKFYEYDKKAPLDPTVTQTQEYGLVVQERVVLKSTNGQKVAGLLWRPKSPEGEQPRCPVVLFLHGYGGKKEEGVAAALVLAPKGRACLALEAQYHGERAVAGADIFSPDMERDRDAMIQTIVDYRRAIDYLETRPEIDTSRIGLIGVSMGGILGGVLAGVEPRIKTAVLLVAGGDWGFILEHSQHPAAKRLRDENHDVSFDEIATALAPVDPLNFVGRISPRSLLMQNGKEDNVVPVESSQLLFRAAKEPKQIYWYDTGHVLPITEAVQRIMEWLDKNL